jgi:predicted flap endonuclease-1-like 5' DNA nuclease
MEQIVLLAFMTLFVGIVCRGKDDSPDVVSTLKSTTPDETVEEYVPEVEEPRAIISELPVETIEGIGSTYGDKLRGAGIESVQDLIGASADNIASVCDVPVEEAGRWIAMGRFCWIDGISEEDAEAIVVATGIVTLDALAAADADDLLARINEAVANGDVRVPEGYTFTPEMVRRWIAVVRDLTI